MHQQQEIYKLPLEEFIAHPEIRTLPPHEPCLVAACDRQSMSRLGYCQAHAQRLRDERRKGTVKDEALWPLTTPAIAESGRISLRGLPHRVIAEILYGVQERVSEGLLHKDYILRKLPNIARAQQIASLTEFNLQALNVNTRSLTKSILKHLSRFGISPETERHKDVWDATAFGMTGTFSFAKITQPWLRKATQAWAIDNIPKRRGKKPTGTIQNQINSIVQLSKSLQLNRPDQGNDPRLLSRDDVIDFVVRLRFLNSQDEISSHRHVLIARDTRRLLTRMRALGLAHPDQPLHGLPEDFALREEDIPDDPEDSEAGRDLPTDVMRQLCDHLGSLETIATIDIRTVTELLIDTGRRPNEICKLPLECLDRDNDGNPVLVYDNFKALRNGRRQPIAGSTASLIIKQQERTRARFPNTPTDKLRLFPAVWANPHGTKAMGSDRVTAQHRAWVTSLPDFLVPTVIEEEGKRVTKMLPFDKAKIYPYAYRHTFAQRHADAGVFPDVLQSLMDHRQATTTQRYYSVSEQRKREAVDRVSTLQFDRHGNRVWRQAKELLESEYARRAVGEVPAPYGVCVEPSNVAAGGHACPARFRCVGCDHFRTDASYLPDLEAYLADLLRNRERLAAFTTVDDWARAEAMPSDEEISRVRRLIRRVKEDLDALTDEDRAQIQEATSVLRRSRRQIVSLGMPRIGPPMPDFRPAGIA
ncbi:tyrosine-type recombinase/integrase [Streptomyces noursei]|uniref:tyrosine-type recombinase/integrase n=1 Tax=Streptomyces noursei TaxID=1971 RepID=UPI001C644BAC|nr:site-specific integrase [Streptomyces noursei]